MPTFLTEPQWYDKNGDSITPEKVKVNNAVSADNADVAERATDYFGKKYEPLSWMTDASWSNVDSVVSPDASGLLLSGKTIEGGEIIKETADSIEREETYIEILPALLRYSYKKSQQVGYPTYINLGQEQRKFGKIYARSFEGPASHVSISEPSSKPDPNETGRVTNSYSFSLDGTTLTLIKK